MAICKDCIHNFVCKYGENRANGGYCTGEKCKQYHSADVVPKSEVDRLETEIRLLTENSISAKYPCHVLCSKGLFLTKSLEEYDELLADISSEVAREIFAEIEAEIKEALNSNYRAKPHIAESEELYHIVDGKIAALSGMEDFIAELKKKYTEGE